MRSSPRRSTIDRSPPVRAALRITWISISWSAAGGAASITAGVLAGSLSLVGSGASVFIDLISSVVLVWRFRRHDEHPGAERIAHLVAALALLALAFGLAVASAIRLASGAVAKPADASLAIAAASVLALPVIAVRKYRVAPRVPSHALRVDAHITVVGAVTALLALVGLGLTSAGFGSADSIAAVTIAAGAATLGLVELRERRGR
jgi:divalent metal cation (Fe/Co/Zn/Cd) transporter